jgi:hypothetical protein
LGKYPQTLQAVKGPFLLPKKLQFLPFGFWCSKKICQFFIDNQSVIGVVEKNYA